MNVTLFKNWNCRVTTHSLCYMNIANYHRELQSIMKRMDTVLVPFDASAAPNHALIASRGASAHQHVVIEAKPLGITPLTLPSNQWCFTGKIPPVYQEQASRREFVEGKTVFETSKDDGSTTERRVGCENIELPSGMSLWHATDCIKRMLVLIRRDLDLFFSADLSGMPYNSTDGVLFALPGNHNLCYHDCMLMVAERAPYVHKAMLEYAQMICCMYGCELRRFLAMGRPRIQRIKRCTGVPLKLIQTHQSRFDGGPVFVVSFGSTESEHDFAPVLSREVDSRCHYEPEKTISTPFRLHMTEGTLVVLDGSMRTRYSHGIPRDKDRFGFQYIFSVHMDCLDTTCVMDYEPLTKTVIMYTPVHGSGVITTRAAPVSRIHSHISIQGDTTWRIVQAMRWRLQMAESNLIRKRYERNLNGGADAIHRVARD